MGQRHDEVGPFSFSALTAASAVASTGAKAISGPGGERVAVSGVSRPKKPSR